MTGPVEYEYEGTLRSGPLFAGAAGCGSAHERRRRHLRLPAQRLRVRGRSAAHAEAAGPRRRRRGQHLRGDRRGGAAGAPGDPPAQARAAGRRASSSPAAPRRSSPRASPPCPRSTASSATPRSSAPQSGRDTRTLLARAPVRHRGRGEDRRQRHHGGDARRRAHLDRRLRRPRPRLRAGAERLRPPLHLLHHPVRPRQFALGADGRGGRAGAHAWSSTAIARSCSPASTSPATAPTCPARRRLGTLVKQILKHVPGARAPAALLDRFGRGRRDLLDALASERAADAASASVAAGRRRLILKRMKRRHLRADAIAFCATGAAAAARHRVRRRHHRRLPDRDRGDVRPLARSRRRMRAHASARLSVLAAPRHAGRAHAAGRARRRQGARAAGCATRARRRCAAISTARSGAHAPRARRGRRHRPHRAVHAGAAALRRSEPGIDCSTSPIAGHDGRQLLAA